MPHLEGMVLMLSLKMAIHTIISMPLVGRGISQKRDL